MEVEEIVIGAEEPIRRCGFVKMLLLRRRRRRGLVVLVGEVIEVIMMKRHPFLFKFLCRRGKVGEREDEFSALTIFFVT